MDTPLVKILLIAAAIAITVGVVVLAWGIFNDSTGDVAEDSDLSITARDEPSGQFDTFPQGPSADGHRARYDNERSCENAGFRWFDVETSIEMNHSNSQLTGRRWIRNSRASSMPDARFYQHRQDLDDQTATFRFPTHYELLDDPQTVIDETQSHCALNADVYSEETGTVERIALYAIQIKQNFPAQPGWHDFNVHFPSTDS